MIDSTRLHKLRTHHHLSYQKLADKIGSTKSYMWSLENQGLETKRPSADMVLRLAKALHTSMEYLLGQETLEEADRKTKVLFRKYRKLKKEEQSVVRKLIENLTRD